MTENGTFIFIIFFMSEYICTFIIIIILLYYIDKINVPYPFWILEFFHQVGRCYKNNCIMVNIVFYVFLYSFFMRGG